jgi:hypothetical protein
MMLASIALLRAGLPDSAKSVIARAAKGSENFDPFGDLLYFEAMARSQLGEKGKAISLLTRYYAKYPQRRAFMNRDESFWWEPLRGDQRYRALVGDPK